MNQIIKVGKATQCLQVISSLRRGPALTKKTIMIYYPNFSATT